MPITFTYGAGAYVADFDVYIRGHSASDITLPDDLETWGTFIATFTKIGELQKESLESNLKTDKTWEGDDFGVRVLTKKGELKVQIALGVDTEATTLANKTTLKDLDGTSNDMLLVPKSGAGITILYPKLQFAYQETFKAGDMVQIPMEFTKVVKEIANWSTEAIIPTS